VWHDATAQPTRSRPSLALELAPGSPAFRDEALKQQCFSFRSATLFEALKVVAQPTDAHHR